MGSSPVEAKPHNSPSSLLARPENPGGHEPWVQILTSPAAELHGRGDVVAPKIGDHSLTKMQGSVSEGYC